MTSLSEHDARPVTRLSTVLLLAAAMLPACAAETGGTAGLSNAGAQPGVGGSGPGGVANYTPPPGGTTSSGGTSATTLDGSTASPGTGGTPIVAPQPSYYDAHVRFDWPESVGDGSAAACKAGHYAGTFTCNFTPSQADGGALPGMPTAPFVVTGPVELVLTESQNGEFLEVSGGTLNGSTFIAITFTGKITGKLDCQTKQFSGMVTDGQYGIQPFPPGGFFEGPTNATYSDTGPALVNGTWRFSVKTTQGASQGVCDGTWTATYAP